MQAFHWNQNFATDLSEVDRQHRALVDLTNELGAKIAANDCAFSDVQDVLTRLVDYAQRHFRDEEEIMNESRIDQRHLGMHREIHRQFIDEVAQMLSGISEHDLEPANRLLEFLTHWLAYHILGVDRNMARQVHTIAAGTDPIEAYESEERGRDDATEPLLAALNGLFQQVSARNRELVRVNIELEARVAERTRELEESNRHLEELSLTDALTGLPNRRHAMRRLESLWIEAQKKGLNLVCMMIDADRFKEVNDTCGHDAGDKVLLELSRALRHSFRTDDVLCRLGGDEFLVICPDTDRQGGMHIAELTREGVSELVVETGGTPWVGSISIGVAEKTETMKGPNDLLKQADVQVYEAKEAGKNCVR